MKIYICDDDYAEVTWVIKSKHRKAFLKTYDWLSPLDLRPYEVNNLHQICIAITGVSGQYTGDIYDPKITRGDILQEEE